MRGSAALAMAMMLVGCEQSEPSFGDMFSPVSVDRPAPAPAAPDAAPEPVPDGSFDFAGADRQDEEEDGEGLDDQALQASLFGVDPSQIEEPPPPAPAPAPAAVAPVAAPSVSVPLWEPDAPIGGSWGLRLLATVHDVQPPRAMIALPDGTELVVQPGQMLPEHKLIVLAVGNEAIQVARVTPQGFYAKVETETVASLFSSGDDD